MATVASTILDPTLQNADAIEFETALNHKVVGQPEAAHKVTTAIQSFMAGLNDPARPIATFLLLGPTGTGKTRCLRPSGGEEAPRTRADNKADLLREFIAASEPALVAGQVESDIQ